MKRRDTSSLLLKMSLGALAYEAIRLAFIPWQRERRLAREQARIRLARFSSRVLATGSAHSLALRREGGSACWGSNREGQAPPAGADGDFVAIAAGANHSLALRRDGSIACWGRNDDGQAPTPEHDEEYGEDEYATLSAKFPFMTDVHILL